MGLEYDGYQLVLEALFVYLLNAVLLNGFKSCSFSLSGIESISYSVLTFDRHGWVSKAHEANFTQQV